MASLSIILSKVNIARLYYVTLVKEYRESLVNGCTSKCSLHDLQYGIALIEALQYDIEDEVNDVETQEIYVELLKFLDGFDETYETDPEVVYSYSKVVPAGAEWGGIIGDIESQLDLMALLALKADSQDGLITPVTFSDPTDGVITITANTGTIIQWKLGNLVIQIPSPHSVNIPDATDGYIRKDWIALTTSGIIRVAGTEDTETVTLPNLPSGALGLLPVDIYGAQVNIPDLPPASGDISAPAWTVYGSTPFGKYGNLQVVPANASFYLQAKEAFQNVNVPNYVQPVAALVVTPRLPDTTTGQNINDIEAGIVLDFLNDATFTAGDAGAITDISITRKVGSGAEVEISEAEPFTDQDIATSQDAIVYKVIYSYAQGDVKNNDVGVPDPRGRIAAGTKSATVTIQPKRRVFYGVGAIAVNSAQVRALPNYTTGSYLELVIPQGQTQMTFSYPFLRANGTEWPDISNTSVLYKEGFDAPVGATFSKAVFNVNDGGGNPVSHKTFTVQLGAAYPALATYKVTLP